MKELRFRSLTANEVEIRPSDVSENGVTLLAYKDARCDQNILDEEVGPYNWQREHLHDNTNCVVSIWDDDKHQWVKKEDTGKASLEESEKGLASDSFKRACFNWGIGRNLYTCPNMFIWKDKLTKHYIKDGKWYCANTFRCSDIKYNENEKYIISITVDIYEYQKKVNSVTFYKTAGPKSPASVDAPSSVATVTQDKPVENLIAKEPVPKISDDTVILMGNCRGKKYGDVKNSAQFVSFLKWASTSDTKYNDKKTQEQFEIFREMGKN